AETGRWDLCGWEGSSSRHLHDGLQNLFRLVNAPAGVSYKADGNFTGHGALNFAHHLSEVQFCDHDGIGAGGDFLDLLFGKRPRSDDAELADLHALVAGHLDSTLRDARGDSIRDDDHIRAFDLRFFVENNLVGVLEDLVLQAAHQNVLDVGLHVGIATLVVSEAGDVDVVALADARHVRNQVFARFVGVKLARRYVSVAARIDVDLLGRRDHNLLGHMTHHFVHHDENRAAKLLCHIECGDSEVEALLRRVGAERDNLVVAVRSPAYLHHVGLGGKRWQTS